MTRAVFIAALAACVTLPATAQEKGTPEAPEIDWTHGPASVSLRNVAAMELPKDLMFADADDTQKLLKLMNNVPDGSEIGLVTSPVEGQDWFIVFEHRAVGFIKDDDRDDIDADALLKGMQRATEEANKARGEGNALHVVGWREPPHYDGASHRLVWAILGRSDDGHEVVNYNIRMLGRDGYVSATFVDEAANFEAARPRLDAALAGFQFNKGRSYAEWVPGDKVADYGLTALVAAGAGAAAVKLGFFAMLGKFLAKAGKALAFAAAAVVAGAVKAWNAARGKGEARSPRPPGTAE